MKRLRKHIPVHRSGAHEAPPGTLSPSAGAHPTRLSVMAYGPEACLEESGVTLDRVRELRGTHPVLWVNMDGLADCDLLSGLGDHFGLHKLALEDTLNIPQRPKLDDYGETQYLTARMPVSTDTLDTEQVSIFLGEGFLLTVQEKPGDCFDGVRRRIRDGRSRIRESGSDYLLYAIVDAIVDAYFPLLESAAVRLDELETVVHANTRQANLSELYDLKRGFIVLRRYLGPLRELVAALLRDENPLIAERTHFYMRDCLDHARQAGDLVESYRDMASGLMDLYLNMMSHRMNEVMKTLTVISTIFIPLSFLAGLYGMNFDPAVSRWNMPELGFAFGYPVLIGIMILVSLGMLAYFRKKGWFR